MELWIRSQDRKKLYNIKKLELDNDETGIFDIETFTLLGKYKSKERALEILDEIQRILQPTIFIKDEQDSFIGKDGNIYKMNVEGMKNSEIQELSTYVYEMPEE